MTEILALVGDGTGPAPQLSVEPATGTGTPLLFLK